MQKAGGVVVEHHGVVGFGAQELLEALERQRMVALHQRLARELHRCDFREVVVVGPTCSRSRLTASAGQAGRLTPQGRKSVRCRGLE